MPPTFAPLPFAQTTNAPTPTRDPNATAFPSPLPPASPTQTLLASTATRTATKIPTRSGPTIETRFSLLDLAGEGRGPGALAVLGANVFVANRGSANLSVIADNQMRAMIPLDINPSALVADPSSNRIYAATYETPTLFLIQDNRIINQVAVSQRVNALALDGDLLYVALDSDAIIERYDTQTLAKKDELKLSEGFGVSALIVDKPRNRLYAALYGKIAAIDLQSFQESSLLEVPYLYSDFAVNPQDGSIWSGAYDEESSRAYVIGFAPDGHEIARLFVGSDLNAATFDDAGRLYVLDHFNNQVHVIQTPQAQLVATIAVNESPSAAVFDAARQSIYVANQDSDNVSVIDASTLLVVHTIPLANNVTALAANPARNRVYAVNASTNLLYAIEGTKIVGQVKTGNSPVDVAVDPQTNRVYVASQADGMLTLIDENTLEIVASEFITRFLSTVAMDTPNQKLFAANYTLHPASLLREEIFYAQGLTLNSQTVPRYERANPNVKKLYAVASNGVPGSNSRVTLYRFLYDDLSQSKMLGSKNGGNTTALAIDSTTNNVYAANTHPLAYTHGLDVFDAQDTLQQSLALTAHTPALAVNPNTHHLFLAHARTYQPFARVPPRDNTIEILDTRTLGQVATLDVPNDPWRMTVLGDEIYIASYRDGSITIVGDAETAQPPAPTPTLTPTPYPTFAATAIPPTKISFTVTPVPTVVAACANVAPVSFVPFQNKVQELDTALLGCTRASESESEQFAYQPLERGFMLDDYRDVNAKKVYVFFPDGTYKIFEDTFLDGQEDKICDARVANNLWRPKRGFGTVWCNVSEVQALGGGLVEEHNTVLTLQSFGNAALWHIPERGVIVLWNDGTWQ